MRAYAPLLSSEQVLGNARRLDIDGARCRLPALRDQVVHNIVHAQLADRHYWLARVPLRPLSDLVRLRAANDGQIDWREILAAFDRAGHGSACRAWLMTAEQLFGQAPAGRHPAGSRRPRRLLAHPGSKAPSVADGGAGGYDYHRAKLDELRAGPAARRRLLGRLLHPEGHRRYFRALRKHVGRAH